jgi:DNA-binding GntR family transcriptional regulator
MKPRHAIVRSILADQVFEALKDEILDAQHAPGARLVIDTIARDLGVSPTPVRDALTRLAGLGLIDSTPFRGFTVLPDPTPEQIGQSFEARAAIETAAVRLGCERATEEQMAVIRELHTRIASQRYGARARSFTPFVRLNQEFHEALVATSGNEFLVDALQSLRHDALVARTRHGRGVPDLDAIVREHAAIVTALERRDVDAVVTAVARHIADGAARELAARRAAE